jgi:hypothetical protein
MTDEERLAAFLDGELGSAERAAVERQMATDPDFATTAHQLQQNDAAMREAFDGPMHEDVPDRFRALLAEAPRMAGAGAICSPVNDNAPVGWRRLGGAVAASLALGLLGGNLLQRPVAGTTSSVTTSVAFNDALDHVASGRGITLAKGGKVVPRLTFASRSGGYCRQFDLDQNGRPQAGIACREGSGWQLQALLPRSDTAQGTDDYAVAEGSGDPALDGVAMALRKGDPLSASEEATLIRRAWHPE